MKIYCLTCKRYVLDTTEAFVCGGPYNGTMFVSTKAMPFYRKYPKHEGIKGRNLQCPWCTGQFLGVSGELLTEHGKIKSGQTTYDPEFNIVWQDGPAKGQLMYIKEAPEGVLPSPIIVNDEVPKDTVLFLNTEPELHKADEIIKEAVIDIDPRKLKVYELNKKGLNNTQIAKEVGVSGVTVGKWLKAKK